MSNDELAGIRERRGLWGDPTFPRTGWRCIGIADRHSRSATCDLCCSSQVRFLHHLLHPASGRRVDAGCVCAGHLLADPVRTQANDTWLRGLQARRRTWLIRRWHRSHLGNAYLRTDGFVVTVFHASDGWAVVIKRRGSRDPGVIQRYGHVEFDEARLEAFALLTSIQLAMRLALPTPFVRQERNRSAPAISRIVKWWCRAVSAFRSFA